MNEQITSLLEKLKNNTIAFKDVLEFIEANYDYKPTAFRNGGLYNNETQNQGSAKVFSFAILNNLSKEDTLSLFAEHYHDVLNDPDGTGHRNIREFIFHGWPGMAFEGKALTAK